ncbi:hypothetical protein VFPPC_17921 [Pochonia chlamydosporia 170]|uniref:Uncharacterized protein n=1 Tax=Pochonia chlamydosporia 170 TaxID=1380566 RepID=A0A219APZ7_METCM|nr:hypothetical protein VFPPC_17921 [Pochonia chlamydosporia 170]OWT42886.1 hypothetical protein VFPPC_17921 [Pochonia chlamydosporia 170]
MFQRRRGDNARICTFGWENASSSSRFMLKLTTITSAGQHSERTSNMSNVEQVGSFVFTLI